MCVVGAVGMLRALATASFFLHRLLAPTASSCVLTNTTTPPPPPALQAAQKRAPPGGGPHIRIGSGPVTLCTTQADDGNYTPCQSVGTTAKKAGALARDQTQVRGQRPPCLFHAPHGTSSSGRLLQGDTQSRRLQVASSALCECGSGAPRLRALHGPCLCSNPPGDLIKKKAFDYIRAPIDRGSAVFEGGIISYQVNAIRLLRQSR
jgi:hypothetical protein